MQRKPNPRTLATVFLLVSAALSIVILGVRNLYDDEISSLDFVTSSVKNILRVTALKDVHPPGMYLLAHFAYSILPSFRWMNLFPLLVVYAGLTIFLLQVTPLFTRTRSQFCLLLLATLHPQLLLWNTTFRWYSWWTGLALITLTTALQPNNPRPSLSNARGLILGLLLTCLFYLNYITFLFAFALGAAILLRYRKETWKLLLPSILITLGVFLALIAPQLHTMLTVHLPDAREQTSGLVASFLRLLLSVSASEAYLPWHPLAIAAVILFAALCVSCIATLSRFYRGRRSEIPRNDPAQPSTALTSIVLFGLLFFLLVAVSGLGGKPRNGLLLIPVLALPAALMATTLRPRAQNATLIFLSLWSAVGIAHQIGRYGLTKATMNARPEQVVTFIAQTTGPDVPSLSPTTPRSLSQSLRPICPACSSSRPSPSPPSAVRGACPSTTALTPTSTQFSPTLVGTVSGRTPSTTSFNPLRNSSQARPAPIPSASIPTPPGSAASPASRDSTAIWRPQPVSPTIATS
jgi:hypothetical protein